MRVGQNPAKSIEQVPLPEKVTLALVTYIPFLSGFYAQSLQVLKVCLNSIWENTSDPFDLMIFDNASCPEVRDFLLDVHRQELIQYLLLSDKNVGKGGAWNFIFQGAPGEYIAYADSDVRFYPGWLEQSLKIMEAFPNVGMVTARPMRSPEAFYTSTLDWARQNHDVVVENDRFIPWEIYREHVLSLGTSEEQGREWYESRTDYRLTYRNTQAYVGAAHFQFSARKSVLQEFLPFTMDRPMGQVRSLDNLLNTSGYLRLNTCEPYVKHMGNRLEDSMSGENKPSTLRETNRLLDAPVIKKPLLWAYDAIFKLYQQ